MNSVLRAGDIPLETLQGLIRTAAEAWDGQPVRIWINAPDGWSFDWLPRDGASITWYQAGTLPGREQLHSALDRSESGRLFSPNGELKWRRLDDGGEPSFRVVFLGSPDVLENELADCSDLLRGLTRIEKRVFLWGQRTPVSEPDWVELRIPHRLRYPVEKPAQRLQLVIESWVDESGAEQFRRLCNVQAQRSHDHA